MIHGLTDKITFRRDGKIRAGYREEGGKMVNTTHFLLHDAEQLIPVLTDKPTEIYFTVHSDDPNGFFQDSLRWYTKSELVCVGDGRSAAYMGLGDVPGVSQTKHPVMPKSRVRTCLYQTCPQYVEGRCGEHFFLDMIIPQYSMGSVFTLDNTSKIAILNVNSAIHKGILASGGKLSGQIFRLYKKEIAVGYTDVEKGKRYNSDKAVIHMDYVPFEVYERTFKAKISADNWAALMGLRSRETRFVQSQAADPLPAPEVRQALPSPEKQNQEAVELLERANHPSVVELIEKLATLSGTPNSEENRVKFARAFADVKTMVDYLQKKIKSLTPKEEKQPLPPPPTPAATQGAPATLF